MKNKLDELNPVLLRAKIMILGIEGLVLITGLLSHDVRNLFTLF